MLACLAIMTSTAAAEPIQHSNQLRAELGMGGPAGVMALRYSRVLPTGMRIEPALGLAYTGVIGSMLITQPFARWDKTTKGGTPYTTELEVYGGYSMSMMRDGTHHPWTGREDFIPNGNYHWVDFGLSNQTKFKSWVLTMGAGASILLSAPMALFEPHEDDHLWFIFPDGWMSKQRWVPTLWSSVGYAF